MYVSTAQIQCQMPCLPDASAPPRTDGVPRLPPLPYTPCRQSQVSRYMSLYPALLGDAAHSRECLVLPP
ncbi:hypothetical protein CP533_3912 [Ophiocordyceps camponoti-saundersi (nom. inval.)]|nr:hypothetical protein CP533_3912 [Ophiocordyceps camponoti-saundersi (nom. inval.)]